MKAELIKTVTVQNNIRMSGYEGEYIFEKISASKVFYEQDLLNKWFPCDNTKIVYDIGANIGNHTVFFATATPQSQIFSFEPIPENFAMLMRNIADNGLEDRVRAFQIAVGEEPGIVYMNITQDANYGSASIVSDGNDSGTYMVEMVPIDNLDLPAPDFIKIDVEGFELSVLRGMKNTLKNLNNVIVWIEVDEKNASGVYSLMHELGFGISTFDIEMNNNIVWTKPNDTCLDDECLFVNLLVESSKKIRENRIVIKEGREKYRVVTQQYGSLKSSYEDQTGQLSEARGKFHEITKKHSELQGRFEELSGVKDEIFSLLKEREKTTRQLEEINKKNFDRLSDALEQYNQLYKDFEDLRKENYEHASLRKKNAVLLRENDEVMSQLADFLTVIKRDMQLASKQNAYLKNENELYRRKLSKITDTWYGKTALWGYRLLKKTKRSLLAWRMGK